DRGPDVFDLKKESEATGKKYGDSEFGRSCVMARRRRDRAEKLTAQQAHVFGSRRQPLLRGECGADCGFHRACGEVLLRQNVVHFAFNDRVVQVSFRISITSILMIPHPLPTLYDWRLPLVWAQMLLVARARAYSFSMHFVFPLISSARQSSW